MTDAALQRIEQPQESQFDRNKRLKVEWQRRERNHFKLEHGYSLTSHYRCGGLRESVLKRDGRKCVRCGMTDAEHKEKYGRPITVDHKDRNRKNNTLENLQTLCLSCHGAKDQLPKLKMPQVMAFKADVLFCRANGWTYRQIADEFGFSIAAVWKWIKRWQNPEIL